MMSSTKSRKLYFSWTHATLTHSHTHVCHTGRLDYYFINFIIFIFNNRNDDDAMKNNYTVNESYSIIIIFCVCVMLHRQPLHWMSDEKFEDKSSGGGKQKMEN
jgi:hypothetical protein